MPPKKKQEDKIQIRNFKDGSSNWFVNNVHYHLNELGEIILIAGGIENEEYLEALKSYVKRNKKVFKSREPSIFEQEQKEYSVISYGKYSGTSLDIIVAQDKKYATWIYKNTSDKKITEELKELLKIK